VVSVVGEGSTKGLLVIGSGIRGKRDERGWHRLHPLLDAGIWLVDYTGTVSSSIGDGRGTLYLPPDVILLQTGVAGLLGDEGEEGLVCPAETGLLLVASGA
jgi:hypothetical protein